MILNKTPLAAYFIAVGGNPEAARIAGVPVTMTKLAACMIPGLMAAVAAMIPIGRLGAAKPTLGTLIGCIILGTLRNGLTLLNVQAFCQRLATGIIISVAMLIDKATSGKTGDGWEIGGCMGDPNAVGAQIRMKLPSLTPLAGKVAKKLGFAGFREFRQGLLDYYRSDTAPLHSEISEGDSPGKIVQKVFRTAMQALEETFAVLDLEAFERAADYLHRARQRDFYGLGGSAQIARDVAHKFLRIGIRASVFDDAHMMMSASLLGPDDVVAAFSHSGTTAAVIDAVELARRGSPG